MAGIIEQFDFKKIEIDDNYILVWLPNAGVEKTKGGIYVTQETQEKDIWQRRSGILAKKGEMVKFKNKEIPTGYKIYFVYYAGEVLESKEGLFYHLLSADKIRAIEPSGYNTNLELTNNE